MKLKIWTEERSNDPLDQLYLRLKYQHDDIILYICDIDGKELDHGTNLLHIDSDFRVVVLLEGVNPKVPLKTDLKDSVLCYDQQVIVDIQKNRAMDRFVEHVVKCQGHSHEETERTSH